MTAASIPETAEHAGLMARLARMEPFTLFLSGFILLYGAVSLLLEHLAGIIGFAKAPYLNAASYLYALGFVAAGLALNKVTIRFFLPHPFAILFLLTGFIAAVTGLLNGNAQQYIVAWSLYIVTAVLVFQFFRNPRVERDADTVVKLLYSPPFLAIALVFAFLSVFNKDNHYQYMLFEVIALYGMLVRPRLFDKAFGAIIYLLIHLGSNDGFVQVEINRASILAVGAIGVLYLLSRRHLVVLFFLIFAALGSIGYALSLDDETVETLPRNIKEAIMLMKGDDVYNHVSSYQRVYEGQMVMEDYRDATDAEWLFGMGLGRTVDMTGAADKTPGQHALLGATEVHNIHFLHFAIFHKFGFAGLALVGGLIVTIFGMFFADLFRGQLDDITLFFYFYLIYTIVFAFPASNFLIANPLWPAFFGMLTLMRRRVRKNSESFDSDGPVWQEKPMEPT